MILTCPRCATRYLADPLHVWATGRTVQCEACGQRWRAVGQGVRPVPEPTRDPPVETRDVEPPPVAPQEVGTPAHSAIDPVQHEPEPPAHVDGATPDDVADPAGTGAGPEPAPPEARPDWHAAPLRAAPATDAPLTVTLSTPPSPRLTASFGSGPSSAGRWLAIAFLVVIVLATLVMFRDVIVQALPGLAPIYAAMGLLVHPVVVPHG